MTSFRCAYFAYFAYLGSFGPFMAIWLRDGLGLDEARTGVVLALIVGVGIAAGLGLARLADRRRMRCRMQRFTSLLGALILPLWLVVPPAWAPLLGVLHGVLLPVQIPLLDAVALDALGRNRHRYGLLRVFGTVGWGVGALVSTAVREQGALEVIVWSQFVFAAAFHVFSWRLPDTQPDLTHADEKRPGFRTLARVPRCFWVLVGVAVLHGCATGHFEMFGSLHIEGLGIAPFQVGLILAAGILAEAVIFLRAPRWLRPETATWLLILAVGISALRWAIVPQLSSFGAFAGLQTLQALTFGLWYAAALHLVAGIVPAGSRTLGQALFSAAYSVGMGLGGAFAGWGRQALGPGSAFYASAAVAAVAALILWVARHRLRAADHSD